MPTQPRDTARQQQPNEMQRTVFINLPTECEQITYHANNFLHQLNPDVYDFAAIQEPFLDSNHNSHATHHWYMVYPKEHYITPLQTRMIILVNRQLALDSWSQVDISS